MPFFLVIFRTVALVFLFRLSRTPRPLTLHNRDH